VSDNRFQKTEDRGPKTEDRRQKPEDGRQTSEDRQLNSEGGPVVVPNGWDYAGASMRKWEGRSGLRAEDLGWTTTNNFGMQID
jgi:hypothetical protein